MKWFLFSIFLISFNSSAQKRIINDFKTLINESKKLDTQILFNGYYNEEEEVLGSLHHFAVNKYNTLPIFFFKNGLICYDYFVAYDSSDLRKDLFSPRILKKKQWLMNWGTYKIEGNQIKAIIILMYWDAFIWEPEATYFAGTIQDQNTIINWHPVPPYPKIKHGGGKLRMINTTLKFKLFEYKKLIDSNKAWVNKYRDE